MAGPSLNTYFVWFKIASAVCLVAITLIITKVRISVRQFVEIHD